jgi:nitronate monooxygenase
MLYYRRRSNGAYRRGMILSRLRYPLVQAPMGPGIGTARLAAAVSDAGALGFLSGGPLAAAALRQALEDLLRSTSEPYGINFWVPASRNTRPSSRDEDQPPAGAHDPTREDPDWEAKLALAVEYQAPVVSFSFGLPPKRVLKRLRDVGTEIWLTANTPEDAWAAEAAGVDVLILQGAEAAYATRWRKTQALSLQSLISLTRQASDLPIVAGGGITDGASMAAALAATATAVQLGTAFMLAEEAATSQAARRGLRQGGPDEAGRELRSVVTASSGGRDVGAVLEVTPRGISLRPTTERGAVQARMYAGQTQRLAGEGSAAEIIVTLVEDAYAALEGARSRLRGSLEF